MSFGSFKGNRRLRINKIVFYKIFLVFVIAIGIPLLVMGTLSYRHSTQNIVKQVNRATESILMEKKSLIDHRMSVIDSEIDRLFSVGPVRDVLTTNTSSFSSYSYKIVDVLNLIDKTIASNPIIDSIYIFDNNHDFVLYDTKYNKSDFFDQEILTLDFNGRSHAFLHERLNNKVVSYARKYYDYSDKNRIIIIVNMKYDMLFDGLMPDNPEYPLETVIYDDELNRLFLNASTFTDINKSTLEDMQDIKERSYLYKLNHNDYYIYKTHSDVLNWNILYLQTYSSIVQSAKLMKTLTTLSILIVVVVGFILAYIFSRYLYKPLRKLVMNVEKYMGNKSVKGENEYSIIHESVEKLYEQNTDLASKYQVTFPHFLQYSISKILSDEYPDAGKFKNILDLLGIDFYFTKHMVILIDLENAEFLEEMNDCFEAFLNQYKDETVHIMSNLSSTRSVIILNTDCDIKSIYSIMQALKEKINAGGTKLTISIGRPYTMMEKINVSFQEALQQMERKFFIGKNEIVLFNDVYASNVKYFYDKGLEEELINSIKSQNQEKAVELLDKLTASLEENACTIEYVKYIYFQFVSNIIYMLLDNGIQPEETEMTGVEIFKRIQNTQTLSELKGIVHVIISKSIDLLNSLKKAQYTMIVNKAIEYIRSNYHRDLSLDDISGKVFMSPRYLNTIFKDETGITIYDYITKMRMEAAKKLILDQNITIKKISETVGYNNIQSFIRMFKIFYKLTPIEYRRKNC